MKRDAVSCGPGAVERQVRHNPFHALARVVTMLGLIHGDRLLFEMIAPNIYSLETKISEDRAAVLSRS